MSDVLTEVSLAKRNITSIAETMKMFNLVIEANHQKIFHLQNSIAQLTDQVQKLIVEVSQLKAKSIGHGSTI